MWRAGSTWCAQACIQFSGVLALVGLCYFQRYMFFRNFRMAAWRVGGVAALGLALCAGAQAEAVAAHSVPDTLGQRLMACTLCHGKEGRATNTGFFPRIAGKPEGYLYHQLRHFRDGRRNNAGMTALLDTLSDAYLREIAAHFSRLDLPYPPPAPSSASQATLAQGARLVREGDASRDLPACAACHGEALTGVAPNVPGLLGLPRDYLVGQLGGWQTGLRRAFEPDCMAHVAKGLAPEEVSAVADWLASQPLPANPHPVQALPAPMPLRCGVASEVAK